MDHTLAIDFGTSNSSVYLLKQKEELLPDDNGNYLFPSFVEYAKGIVAVGDVAKKNLGRPGHFVVACIKRILGLTFEEYEQIDEKGVFGCEIVRGEDGYPRFIVDREGRQVSCEEVAAELFKAVKRRADTFNSPNVYDQCYITVPANYKDAQCKAICRAAKIAGLAVTKMIPEPTAAALSYLLDSQIEIGVQEKVLVYDFGGGTFDASVLTYDNEYGTNGFSILGEKGNNRLGGNDVDLAIMEYVKRLARETTGEELIPPGAKARQRNNRLKRLCEDAKLTLACTPNTEIDLCDFSEEMECVNLTVSTLDNIVSGIIRSTIGVVEALLGECGLQKGNIKRVFMVGGSSKLTAAHKGMKGFFGASCEFPTIDADHCVSLGAMKVLEADSSEKAEAVTRPLQSSYGVGIDEEHVLLVLKRGYVAPCVSRRYVFAPFCDGQREAKMKIYRWDGDPDLSNASQTVSLVECQELFPLDLSLKNGGVAGLPSYDLSFSFDFGGSLSVSCYAHRSTTLLFSHTYKPLYGMIWWICLKTEK